MGAHDHRPELSHRTTAAGRHKAPLVGALTLTGGFLVVEVVGALWTGSLALLVDAGHMLTDVGGLSLSLLRSILHKGPPPRPIRTATSAPRFSLPSQTVSRCFSSLATSCMRPSSGCGHPLRSSAA